MLQARNLSRLNLQRQQVAHNTEKGYAHDWKMFQSWCRSQKRKPLPATPKTVALYLTDIIEHGRTVATAIRRTSGISYYHRTNGFASPVNLKVWQLIDNARRLLCEQPRQMRPLTVEQLREISGLLRAEGTRLAIRDRAIVVMGFASALRRASLADLELSDVEVTDSGLVIHVRREKQDQRGKGRYIGVPFGKHADTCTVSCLRDWLMLRGAAAGPLFTPVRGANQRAHLSPAMIGRAVKLGVARIGLDETKYAGHSLRAGFVTAAVEAGAGELVIAAQTGHRTMKVLRGYFRRTDVFRSNACRSLDL